MGDIFYGNFLENIVLVPSIFLISLYLFFIFFLFSFYFVYTFFLFFLGGFHGELLSVPLPFALQVTWAPLRQVIWAPLRQVFWAPLRQVS